jgi:hypothetical protein
MNDLEQQISSIEHSGWLNLPATQNFLANLEKERQKILKHSEDYVYDSSEQADCMLRNYLVTALTLRTKVIDYANNNPKSISRE